MNALLVKGKQTSTERKNNCHDSGNVNPSFPFIKVGEEGGGESNYMGMLA